jgi:hypothetical protein
MYAERRVHELGLHIHYGLTEYLTLDVAVGIVTETGQIKIVNESKHLASILKSTGATTLEVEKNN